MVRAMKNFVCGSVVLGLAALLVGGCAEQQTLTREESLAMTTRFYSGVTKQQVIDAAERLFRLADGDDVSLVHHENGFHATRGLHWWDVGAAPVDVGIKVVVIHEGRGPHGVLNAKITYAIFWNRFEYLLGKETHWITCPEAAMIARRDGYTFWSLGPLCLGADDKHPDPANDDRAKFSVTD